MHPPACASIGARSSCPKHRGRAQQQRPLPRGASVAVPRSARRGSCSIALVVASTGCERAEFASRVAVVAARGDEPAGPAGRGTTIAATGTSSRKVAGPCRTRHRRPADDSAPTPRERIGHDDVNTERRRARTGPTTSPRSPRRGRHRRRAARGGDHSTGPQDAGGVGMRAPRRDGPMSRRGRAATNQNASSTKNVRKPSSRATRPMHDAEAVDRRGARRCHGRRAASIR